MALTPMMEVRPSDLSWAGSSLVSVEETEVAMLGLVASTVVLMSSPGVELESMWRRAVPVGLGAPLMCTAVWGTLSDLDRAPVYVAALKVAAV